MRTFTQKFLLSLACLLFVGIAIHAQYQQGDTIDVLADRYLPTLIEGEWFDADSSFKFGDPTTVPSIAVDGDISYVDIMPNDMILKYNIRVGSKGGTYKMIYTYQVIAPSGNIRYWIDGAYLGGSAGTAQSTLPGVVTGDWVDFADSREIALTPGIHSFGIRMNRSNSHYLDYFQLVPVDGKLDSVGHAATVNITANDGMVTMSPDYGTEYNVGDLVEFTATPNDNYYFRNWKGDASGTDNPMSFTLDTTNSIVAKIYRTPDTAVIAADRYAPVKIEAETATLWWDKGNPVDSLTDVGDGCCFKRQILDDGTEVITNFMHEGKLLFPVNVGNAGGVYIIDFAYIRRVAGGGHGAFFFIDDDETRIDYVDVVGDLGVPMTTSSMRKLKLTPGYHTITMFPRGGSGKYDLDYLMLTPMSDSLGVTEAQIHVTAENGSVAKDPDFDIHYAVGETLSLTATPDFGFLFDGWSGDVIAPKTENPLEIVIDSGLSIVANFIDDPDINDYTVTVTLKDSGMVTFSPDMEDYVTGSSIELLATPDFGYRFAGWSGDTVSTENPIVIDSIAKDYNIDANFEALPTYSLTIDDEFGLTTKSLELDAYPEGAVVVLTANQNREFRFAYWNDDMGNTSNTLEVTITSDTVIKVNYEAKDSFVSGDIIYIDADEYITDTIQAEWYDLELSDENYTGDLELVIDTIPGTDTIYVRKMGNYKNMGFTFEVGAEGGVFDINYHYRRTVAGTSRVRFSVDGLRLDGSGNIGDWTMVDLPPMPIDEWTVFDYPEDMHLTPGKHIIKFSANYSDRHECDFFTLDPVPGTIAAEGGLLITFDEEKGSVTKNPDKLVYDKGETVLVTAEAMEGYMFSDWTGDYVGTENPLTITMDSTIKITANFVAAFSVTINANTINGTVEYSPIKDLYPIGESVTFTPIPDDTYKFDGWFAEGGIGGADIPLVIEMNRDIDLTAYFSKLTYILTTTAENGSIEKSPSKISYDAGTQVELTATADEGYEFTGWSGDATGTNNPLTITMDSAISITADFTFIIGVENNSTRLFRVYPNPSNGRFTVDISPDEVTYSVISISGRVVKNGIASGSFVLDMSEFNKGVYALSINTQNRVLVKRIIVE